MTKSSNGDVPVLWIPGARAREFFGLYLAQTWQRLVTAMFRVDKWGTKIWLFFLGGLTGDLILLGHRPNVGVQSGMCRVVPAIHETFLPSLRLGPLFFWNIGRCPQMPQVLYRYSKSQDGWLLARLASLSARALRFEMWSVPVWWPWPCMTAACWDPR